MGGGGRLGSFTRNEVVLQYITLLTISNKQIDLLIFSIALSAPPQNVTVISVTYFSVLLKWFSPTNEKENGRVLQYTVSNGCKFEGLSCVMLSCVVLPLCYVVLCCVAFY